MFTKWLSCGLAASRQAGAGRIGRRRRRGQKPRRLAMERLEDRLALSGLTATFDFEEQIATSGAAGSPGARSMLPMARENLYAVVYRPGSKFDVFNNEGFAAERSFGKRSLDPFYDYRGPSPFLINFSQPLNWASVAIGDYGQDQDNLKVEAFDRTNESGQLLSTKRGSLRYSKSHNFSYCDLKVTAPDGTDGILSLRISGGSTEFPSSTYVDNIKVEYGSPDIKLLDATCNVPASRAISIKFSISGNDVRQEFAFRAYLSEDEHFDEGDTLLPGTLNISNAKERKAGANGAEKAYKRILWLSKPPAPSKTSRFVIVVADANDDVCESNENNNAMFVIPLFKEGRQAGYHLNTGMFWGILAELKAVPPIGSRISRGTAEYSELLGSPANNIKSLWNGNGRGFELQDTAPFVGDDWTVQTTLVAPLTKFIALIDLAKGQNRLDAPYVCITDAFDEDSGHCDTSLHYEGRAIDFDCENTSALGRLAGLATLAGFDWVYHEVNHIHVSHKGVKTTEASAASILAALDWGYNTSSPKLVTSEKAYWSLFGPMYVIDTKITEAGGENRLTPEAKKVIRGELKQFRVAAKEAQDDGEILRGFAKGNGRKAAKMGLLVYNAERLRQRLGIAS